MSFHAAITVIVRDLLYILFIRIQTVFTISIVCAKGARRLIAKWPVLELGGGNRSESVSFSVVTGNRRAVLIVVLCVLWCLQDFSGRVGSGRITLVHLTIIEVGAGVWISGVHT